MEVVADDITVVTDDVAGRRRRMRGDDRRSQLLDAAARVVVDHGASAFNMERLAVEAGVSKALPYKHFANSDEVLTELYRRASVALGRHVWRSLRDAPPDSDLVRVGVCAYFDQMVESGPVLAALSRPGSTTAATADPGQAGVRFEVDVLARFHGVPRARAKVIAGMVQGAVVGAAATYHAGLGTREDLEDALVVMIRAIVAADGGDSASKDTDASRVDRHARRHGDRHRG